MKQINNEFYHDLGDKWFEASSHPIALLRAENRLRNPWIISHLAPGSNVIDLGCGAGFLTSALSRAGHHATGIDLSKGSLETAKKHDAASTYIEADATNVPLPSHTFDAVCAMDLLEHVPDPQKVVQEAARLLKPGGLFFFHTFNRTFMSWLLVIKGVDWFVKNAPPNMHVFDLFIKPKQLTLWCAGHGMQVQEIKGCGLKWNSLATWSMALTREVPENLEFCFNRSLKMGYTGYATLK
ncbi:MAG: bifunctional 2-polyprenyl-6-hydroxyphenol methylase/3-demethylubiquinol 3-O-methyltransferase UbiG [Rhabdochlamydiaceae bacterium]